MSSHNCFQCHLAGPGKKCFHCAKNASDPEFVVLPTAVLRESHQRMALAVHSKGDNVVPSSDLSKDPQENNAISASEQFLYAVRSTFGANHPRTLVQLVKHIRLLRDYGETESADHLAELAEAISLNLAEQGIRIPDFDRTSQSTVPSQQPKAVDNLQQKLQQSVGASIRCPSCDSKQSKNAPCCRYCGKLFKPLPASICPMCESPLKNSEDKTCTRCGGDVNSPLAQEIRWREMELNALGKDSEVQPEALVEALEQFAELLKTNNLRLSVAKDLRARASLMRSRLVEKEATNHERSTFDRILQTISDHVDNDCVLVRPTTPSQEGIFDIGTGRSTGGVETPPGASERVVPPNRSQNSAARSTLGSPSEDANVRITHDEKDCPFCAERIKAKATLCKHCKSKLPVIVGVASSAEVEIESSVVETAKNVNRFQADYEAAILHSDSGRGGEAIRFLQNIVEEYIKSPSENLDELNVVQEALKVCALAFINSGNLRDASRLLDVAIPLNSRLSNLTDLAVNTNNLGVVRLKESQILQQKVNRAGVDLTRLSELFQHFEIAGALFEQAYSLAQQHEPFDTDLIKTIKQNINQCNIGKFGSRPRNVLACAAVSLCCTSLFIYWIFCTTGGQPTSVTPNSGSGMNYTSLADKAAVEAMNAVRSSLEAGDHAAAARNADECLRNAQLTGDPEAIRGAQALRDAVKRTTGY